MKDSIYRRGDVGFRIGALPAEWRRVQIRGEDLAFRHRDGGTLLVHGQCRGSDDAPLDVLVNHLVIGLQERREISRTPLVLDGRAALRALYRAEVDGVPVQLGLVVLKKDDCVYDLQLVASPQVFAARVIDFDAFVAGFATLPPFAPK